MIFGKIEYLNLLPFHSFLKRYLRHSVEKKAWLLRGGVPSKINRDLERGRVDAAVVSSIRSRNKACADFGIVANGAVQSVLLFPGEASADSASETSNALAEVLGLRGQVVIGDRALKRYLAGDRGAIDLAEEWYRREGLPFVFARLCARRRHLRRIRRIARLFFRTPVRPSYRIRKMEAQKRGITVKELDAYLRRIHYRIGWRERRALKRFFSMTG